MNRSAHRDRTPRRTNDAWTDYIPPLVLEVEDEPFRYWVESQSEKDKVHLVDLTERGGRGMCDCLHFQTVANPNFRRHGMHIPYAPKRQGVTECKHIAAAFAHYHEFVTVPMLARFKAGVTSPTPLSRETSQPHRPAR